jgi:hypothetical protein
VVQVGETPRDAKVHAAASYVRAVLFVGSKRLFFRDHPIFFTARHTAMRLQRTPISRFTRSNKHSSVASGSFRSHRSSCSSRAGSK